MRKIICLVVCLLCCVCAAYATLLPPSFVNSVVALGHNELRQDGSSVWVTEASGFFYGYLVQDDPDAAKRQYEMYLVTNRHVILNHNVIYVRMNPTKVSDQGQVFDAPMFEGGVPQWFTHKDAAVDIAATRINWKLLQDRGISFNFIPNDTQSADIKKMQEIGVSAGDGIFVIGFPMNLAGQQRNYAIVRPGAIARVSDLLESAASTFLIDSHVFPGNSGGPVVLEPNPISLLGMKSNNQAYVIGVVSDYITYTDVAVSPQTQHPRITFEENSGLADVIPVDKINEAIKNWRDSLPAGTKVPVKSAPEK
jgi:Trypsin-like peptidase domain